MNENILGTQKPATGLLPGKKVAKVMYAEAKALIEAKGPGVRPPHLSVILVGDDPASKIYVKNKARLAERLGIESETLHLPSTITEEELLAEVERLNEDPGVDGILVQLPVPEGIDARKIQRVVRIDKDVDGFHPMNQGLLVQSAPGLRPCTPQGIMKLLDYYDIPLAGKRAVVMGRSLIVGKPMAQLLLNEDCTVTQIHSKTRPEDSAKYLSEAEIVVVAIGKPEGVAATEFKPGATVIDVGIHYLDDGRIVGDVAQGAEVCVRITPVPGGVGPLTVAQLMLNCVTAWNYHLS